MISLPIDSKSWLSGFNNLGLDDNIELDIDVDEETEKALKAASTSDIIDLAGVLVCFYFYFDLKE